MQTHERMSIQNWNQSGMILGIAAVFGIVNAVIADVQFGAPVIHSAGTPVGQIPHNIVAGDLNGNGYPDLVVTKASEDSIEATGRINILFNNGDGTYSSPVTLYSNAYWQLRATGIALADLTGNGSLDIVARMTWDEEWEDCYDEDYEYCDCYSGNCYYEEIWTERGWALRVWENDGSGTFTMGPVAWGPWSDDISFWVEYTSLGVADFTGNGHLDVVAPMLESGLRLFQNDGSGNLSMVSGAFPSPFLSGTAMAVVAVDINNNGHMDIVSARTATGSTDNRIRVFLNDGTGSFTIEGTYETQFIPRPGGIAAGDLTGNGYADIVTANNGVTGEIGATSVSLFVNTGGTLSDGVDFPVSGNARQVAVADMTLNGSNEIVVTHGDAVEVLTASGDSLAHLTHVAWSRPWALAVADLNGSGVIDVAITDRDNNLVSVILNETEPSCPSPADLNCDGVVDGADLLILLSNWGECADCDDCLGNLNDDCTVDGADLLILLSNWG
jgi:hypothetical protein